VITAVKKDGGTLKFADKNLKNDKKIVLLAVKNISTVVGSDWALHYASKKLRANKEIVLAAVKHTAKALQHADKKLRGDKKIVLEAVKNYGEVLEYADKKLKSNKEVVLAAVSNDGSALKFCDKKLKSNKEVVLAAVKNYWDALEYADKKLRGDKDIILEAIKKEARNIKYADKKLKEDQKIMLTAISKSAFTFEYANEKLKFDKKFVLLAVKKNSAVLEYVNDNFKMDKEVILAVIKKEPSLIQYAHDQIKSDREFMTKNIIEKEIFEENFIKNKKLKRYKYSVEVSGSGGEIKSSVITKKTYDFFANDNDLLISHVNDDNNEDIPEDVWIGPWYEASDFFEASSYSLGDSSLTLQVGDETINIPLNEKALKKMGVELVRTKKDFKDNMKKSETGYFFLGERVEKGTTSSEFVIDHPFNPKKLKVETCNFNEWETIESITYDGHSIDCYMGDSTHKYQEFKVLKVRN